MRPVIGLSTYREQARWGLWDQVADLLPASYADSVATAGGVPVLLPPVAPYAEGAAAAVARLDGLIVAGGADVEPARYGEETHASTLPPRPDRDAWELALLDAADRRGIATLGVCRGMQVMAVHGGGALEQHLPDVVGHRLHDPGGDTFGVVDVEVRPGSRLAGALGTAGGEGLTVGCHHHQSVRAHPGYAAVAWAADGTLEAIEAEGDRFHLGVQWHPEVAADAGLFAALVAAAGGTS